MPTLILLMVAPWTACTRKAPQPDDCLQAALRWHGVPPGDQAVRLSPQGAQQVKQMTLDCVTKPYPRQYVSCVKERGRSSVCQLYAVKDND